MIEAFCKNWNDPEGYIGKYVMVTDCSVKSYYKYNIEGHMGYIRNYRSTTGSPCTINALAVEIEGKENPASEKGLFWLKPCDLTIIKNEKENDDVISRYSIQKVMEGYKVCVVEISNTGEALPGIHYDEVKECDLVAIQTNNSILTGTVLRTNVPWSEVDTKGSPAIYFQVIGRVDNKAYNERQEKLKKRSELKEKMKERAAKFQEEQFWKMIAAEDKEMANLLEEYNKYAK